MNKEEQPVTIIDQKELAEKADKLFKEGHRLVLITCTKLNEGHEITYSFDKDYKFQSLRFLLPDGGELQSITGIYWGAFIFENEIHDLFGISVKGINVDYKGNLYKTAVKFPFSLDSNKEVGSCQSK